MQFANSIEILPQKDRIRFENGYENGWCEVNFSSAQDERGYNQIFNPYGSTLFRAERRYQWFLEHVKNSDLRHIIELGCGTGEAAAYIASRTKAHVTAIDISEKFLNLARERYRFLNLEFVKYEIAKDGMSRFEKIDFIFGNGVLHHLVPVLDHVLIDMAHAMRSNDQMAFIEPTISILTVDLYLGYGLAGGSQSLNRKRQSLGL